MAVIAKIKIDKKEPPEIRPSMNKAKYAALIEAYKTANPVKYHRKKAELEAKLAKL